MLVGKQEGRALYQCKRQILCVLESSDLLYLINVYAAVYLSNTIVLLKLDIPWDQVLSWGLTGIM